MQPATYLLASQRNGTLYVGVTSDLVQRIWQHREGLVEGFTRPYGVKLLVWYELHESMIAAITREKQIKEWKQDPANRGKESAVAGLVSRDSVGTFRRFSAGAAVQSGLMASCASAWSVPGYRPAPV